MTGSATVPPPGPAERLHAIVEQGLCIGCGLCQAVAGPGSISVRRVASGYEAPVVTGPLDHATVDTIYDVCPGTRIDGLPDRLVDKRTVVDPVWGPWRRIVRAWAADPDVRHRGSTGGVLTALCVHLLESGQVDHVLHVRASSTEPTFGEPTLSSTPDEVLEAVGSRYGPTATLRHVTDALDLGRPLAFVGKPCDIAALRNWGRHDPRVDDLVRVWLTPVCGGFGTPDATRGFLDRVGIHPAELTALRYRGHGCPGPTRAETADRVEERHYLDFWGDDESQWTLPWRCKVCPDGIGEAADLAASDTWPGGSPDRVTSETDPGTNAVVARTEVGRRLLAEAEAAGAIEVEGDIGPAEMGEYQPHQVRKKYAAGPRHEALGAAGRIQPVTHRLRLRDLAAELPPDEVARQHEGVRIRIADGRATQPTPSIDATESPTGGSP